MATLLVPLTVSNPVAVHLPRTYIACTKRETTRDTPHFLEGRSLMAPAINSCCPRGC